VQQLPIVAAVRGSVCGWLALLADGDERILVGDDGSGATTEPRTLCRLVAVVGDSGATPRRSDLSGAMLSIDAWWRRHTALEQLHKLSPEGERVRACIAARVATHVADTARHALPRVAALAAAARQVLGVRLGMGAERELRSLADAAVTDDDWLRRLAKLAAGRTARGSGRKATVLVLILLYSTDDAAGGGLGAISGAAPPSDE
jgi:hypothetical protein